MWSADKPHNRRSIKACTAQCIEMKSNSRPSQILCSNSLVEKDFEVWKVRKVLKSMERLPNKDILFRWKLPFINAQTQPGSILKQVSYLFNIIHSIKCLMKLKDGLSPNILMCYVPYCVFSIVTKWQNA